MTGIGCAKCPAGRPCDLLASANQPAERLQNNSAVNQHCHNHSGEAALADRRRMSHTKPWQAVRVLLTWTFVGSESVAWNIER